MELAIEESFIAPRASGLDPPRARHRSYNHRPIDFGTINVALPCNVRALPTSPCVLDLSPLVLAIIDHFINGGCWATDGRRSAARAGIAWINWCYRPGRALSTHERGSALGARVTRFRAESGG